MAEITAQIILSTIQTTGLLVGIFYYILTLNNQQKTQKHSTDTREAQLYMQLFLRISSEEYMKRAGTLYKIQYETVEEFFELYNSDLEIQSKWMAHMWHIDGIGYLMHEGYVKPEVVYNFGQGIGQIDHWLKWKPVILEMRKGMGNPEFLMWFEYLVGEIMRLREEKGLSPTPKRTQNP